MANEPQKNQNWQPAGGWKAPQNKNALIIAGTVIILLGIYFVTRGNTQTGVEKETAMEDKASTDSADKMDENKGETAGAMTDKAKEMVKDTMSKDTSKEVMLDKSSKVNITGTLKASDNQDKGNLMLSTSSGPVYVHTSRDFSSLMGTDVTLTGTGSNTAFTLDNIASKDATTAMTDTTAKGGEVEGVMTDKKEDSMMQGNVHFSGKLEQSDLDAKGNYMITSGSTKLYLATSKDYSGWIGGDVNLTAEGTLTSFGKAMLEKK